MYIWILYNVAVIVTNKFRKIKIMRILLEKYSYDDSLGKNKIMNSTGKKKTSLIGAVQIYIG